MASLEFGLIGSGFIGRAHAIALHAVGTVFDGVAAPVCRMLADSGEARATAAARALGFAESTGDWRVLVANPQIDVVDICTPNYLHREMALAAIAAGKHVYCEKPLANTAAEATEIALAAQAAGVHHLTGFNYICNPLLQTARQMIAAGELGEVHGFRGCYLEDYMANPEVPWSWRCSRELAGAGALADLGSHLINLGHFLIGDISRVQALLTTVHPNRFDPGAGTLRAVENEDSATVLVEFASGVRGSFEISRVATGYKCALRASIVGTRGTLEFDQERMNELRFYDAGDRRGAQGFRTILVAPEHPDFRAFCPAPGHGLGYNDLKVIEMRNLIRAIDQKEPAWPDFFEGARVQRVMEAIEQSHKARLPISIGA